MELLGYNIESIYPEWPSKGRLVINTINPHSYCVAREDKMFKGALKESHILIPDGIGITYAAKIIKNQELCRITGAQMHKYLLEVAQENKLKVFYLGSTEQTLQKISERISKEYPNIDTKTYSPPFKTKFSSDENYLMIDKVNEFSPHILFVGMTAPKQEKWVHQNKDILHANIISSVGAVFDFYSESVKRAPKWMADIGLEWLYRLAIEPKRMWRRYLINNTKFLIYIFQEKYL